MDPKRVNTTGGNSKQFQDIDFLIDYTAHHYSHFLTKDVDLTIDFIRFIRVAKSQYKQDLNILQVHKDETATHFCRRDCCKTLLS